MNDAEKINRAIRACIRDCFGSNAVLARVARFLDDLRATPGWYDSEIRLVERGVRGMLKAMVAADERPIDMSVRQSA